MKTFPGNSILQKKRKKERKSLNPLAVHSHLAARKTRPQRVRHQVNLNIASSPPSSLS